MNKFQEAYSRLNVAQKKAVDTIDGPVMVVAGPGTGKTQLLSVRVANILKQTDVLPGNILCLTFTESAAAAMRKRLVGLMGADAYKVAIHTFHSFGTEIINHNSEHFYQGGQFQPADELSSFEVLELIFSQLDHHDPLLRAINDEFTALPDTRQAISHLKRAGLSPRELKMILDHNELFIDYAEPLLAKAFDVPRLNAKKLEACKEVAEQLKAFVPSETPFKLFTPLSKICVNEFDRTLDEAIEAKSTKPLTAWRNRWLERNKAREFVFKDRARYNKLRSMTDIYDKYSDAMTKRELFDFDDMIIDVVQAMENIPELRYNLQEQYQYVLVDEFQDTNGAQTRLLHSLLSSPVHEGRPNIMVVGDDDQAIYAFQGAEISNLLQFADSYREPVVVTLTDNYRSTDDILTSARQVITQAEVRLETSLQNVNKKLTAHVNHSGHREVHQFAQPTDQFGWIVEQIQQLIASGKSPSEIAILGRNHRQLLEILPYLNQAGVAVNYERRNNVLESDHVTALITLARAVDALAQQRFDMVDAMLPELLSYKFWGLKPDAIWKLSLEAYKSRKLWLEIMLQDDGRLNEIAEFLIVASHQSQHEPLEVMLDILIGSSEAQVADNDSLESVPFGESSQDEQFTSPFRAYYFNAARLTENPSEYLTLLSNLKRIRQHLREYRPDEPLLLNDFTNFITLHKKAKMPIVDTAIYRGAPEAVQLMTAHKSKGLEFDTVFVLSSQESIWGSSARSHHSSLAFPHNLPITPAGQTTDDCLRLFFVAMTRAKYDLYLCNFSQDNAGKESLAAAFLQLPDLAPVRHEPTGFEIIKPAVKKPASITEGWEEAKALLTPQLETYKLSATHLNNFIDVTSGGPQAFLLQNLLRFPQAMSPSAIFGTAIHRVLQRTHAHLAHNGDHRPIEDTLQDYETQLQNARLSEREFNHLLEKGSDVLQAYLMAHSDTFKPDQKAEYSFSSQGIVIGEAKLTGAIDLIEIDKANKTISVIDYKTGKPTHGWQGKDDYERIKLHKYRQQLMLYKILVENSRDFGGRYTVKSGLVRFVEAPYQNTLTHKLSQTPHEIDMEFDSTEMERFTKLIQVVWQKIMTLDLPDTSSYPATYKGLLAFEEDLLSLSS